MGTKIIIALLILIIIGLTAGIFAVRAEMRKLIRGVKISRGWRYSTTSSTTQAAVINTGASSGMTPADKYKEGYEAGLKAAGSGIDDGIVAAIAAAVAACSGPDRRLVIKNIRRTSGGGSAWQSAARMDQLR